MHSIEKNTTKFPEFVENFDWNLPERSDNGGVLLHLHHGGVEQRLDALQTLHPSQRVLPLPPLHGTQLLSTHPREVCVRLRREYTCKIIRLLHRILN